MTEKLGLVLRALIVQADRMRGRVFTAKLSRGLLLRVTRSTETENYKLECGRQKCYAGPIELAVVATNWPKEHQAVDWHTVACREAAEVHWIRGIVKPGVLELEGVHDEG